MNLILFAGCSKKVTMVTPQASPLYAPSPTNSEYEELLTRSSDLEFKKAKSRVVTEDRRAALAVSKEGYNELNEGAQEGVTGYLDNASTIIPANSQGQTTPDALDAAMAPKTGRMVTYTGTITTRSTNPDSLLETALQLAKSVDGYIERREQSMVTVRVPAHHFAMVYDSLVKLGEVVSFNKFTEDITDAFRDTDQRIAILQKTIDRYVQLLLLVEKETEKITLLKAVEALQEEMEFLKVLKKTLAKRAEYATIHFTVEARETGFRSYAYSAGRGFTWIQELSPFNYKKFGGKLTFCVPEGMVLLKKKNPWAVQSPGGTRVWSGRIKNKPCGTETYWIDAILFRLKDEYQFSELDTVGNYHLIWFTPYPGSGYLYAVGVKVVKKNIYVIQCYFPNEEQIARYRKAVEIALSGKRAS